MGIIENKIIDKLNINFVKLFNKGKIDRLYEKIYILAEKLALHEMKKKSSIILHELEKKYKNERNDDIILEYLKGISVYKDERIKFHMDEMKNWLELNLKNKK